MLDLTKEIWQTMRTNKLRTFLTGFSVAWGIFMLILLLAIANGLINSTQEQIQSGNPNRITLWSGITTMPFMGMKEGRIINLQERDLEAIKSYDRHNIANVTGNISIAGQISTPLDYLAASSCIGVYPSYFNSRFNFFNGRPINEADIKNQRKSIVLAKSNAETLFGKKGNYVGEVVNVGKIAFSVVGVYEHEWDDDTYIPFSTAYALSGYQGTLSNIDVHIRNVSDDHESGRMEEEVISAMARKENFDPNDKGAIYTFDRFASAIQQQKALIILNGTMWTIGILTLITGIVGVSNIMFVSVRERTHEIGIRRAIGAKPRSILLQVVLESVALTTCFGYIGIVMGTIATEIVKVVFADSEYMLNPTVDISIAIEVTIALIAAGALAGIFPAMRALKVKPVEALRDE